MDLSKIKAQMVPLYVRTIKQGKKTLKDIRDEEIRDAVKESYEQIYGPMTSEQLQQQ